MSIARPNEKVDNVFAALVKKHLAEGSSSKSSSSKQMRMRSLTESSTNINDNEVTEDFEGSREVVRPTNINRSKKVVRQPIKQRTNNFMIETLIDRIQSSRMIAALRLTCDNLDDIVDDNDDLYANVYEGLSSLDKEELLRYISVLIGALR